MGFEDFMPLFFPCRLKHCTAGIGGVFSYSDLGTTISLAFAVDNCSWLRNDFVNRNCGFFGKKNNKPTLICRRVYHNKVDFTTDESQLMKEDKMRRAEGNN